jgi:hypothetical protein
MLYVHHRIDAAPRRWREAAGRLAAAGAVPAAGGTLYGIWRSQIGRPRDELTAITAWPAGIAAEAAEAAFIGDDAEIRAVASETLTPTLRPADAAPPVRQGNYAFRWFATPEADWPEFLDLCAEGWPGFEAAYDSQVIGLWRATGDRTGGVPDPATGAGSAAGVRSLLLTRRPDLAMWERSKLPEGAAEQAVRDTLSRRYDLCDWTVVSTATLLTAQDAQDRARWA